MKPLKLVSVFVLSLFLTLSLSCEHYQFEGNPPDDGGGGASSCVEASNNASDATTAFSAVTPADANYTVVCIAYANALQDLIDLCGDPTDSIQAIIDGLDCSGTGGGSDGIFTVEFDGQTFIADFIESTRTDDVINITGMRGANQELVTITVYGTTAGTYEFGVQNGLEVNAATYAEENGSTNVWVSVTDGVTPQGSITISEMDETNLTLTGTFNFTGTNSTAESKEFTNGVFTDIPFNDGLTNNNDNTFFARVDGVEFVEDQIQGAEMSIGGNQSISISATKNSGETIGFSFAANITPGDYTFDGFGGSYVAQYIGEDSTDLFIGDGGYTIISHDIPNRTVSGIFSFTANSFMGPETKEITEGEFTVTYF